MKHLYGKILLLTVLLGTGTSALAADCTKVRNEMNAAAAADGISKAVYYEGVDVKTGEPWSVFTFTVGEFTYSYHSSGGKKVAKTCVATFSPHPSNVIVRMPGYKPSPNLSKVEIASQLKNSPLVLNSLLK